MSARPNPDARIDRPDAGIQAASSTSRFVEANGLKLHYLDYGTAGRPPLICLHGGAVNAHWFDFVAGAFTPGYHVRALDHRGHGDSARSQPPDYSYKSYAADVAEVVEKLDLRDFVLMGHSMGGLVSLVYAATYPGRVKKIIAIDSTLRATPERVSRLHEIGAREGKTYPSNEEFTRHFRVRPAGTAATPEIIRHLGERSGRQGPDGLWRHKFDRNVYGKRVLLDIPPHWNKIGIPALLVKGGRSDRITPEIYADIKARCPQVELVEVPGADHHVMLDNPSGFIHAVKTWLGETPLKPAPHTGKFIEANGLKLHDLDYGTEGRPPMLCLHGGAAHGHWWDFVAGAFAPDYHVRALDLRGHGDSEWADPPVYSFEKYASDVNEVVEKLDLRDFVLMGHSMGGMVSLVYSATHPGRVARLVLVDTTMHMPKESIARLRDLGNRPAKAYATREALIKRYRLQPDGLKIAPAEVVRHVAQHSGRQMPDGHWQHKFDRSLYSIFERLDGKPYWNHVKIPALLVKGEHSDRVNETIFAEVKARSPQAQMVEVPAADHHVTLDNPEGLVKVVREFLASSPPG